MAKGKQYSQQFEEDAIRYKEDHPKLQSEKLPIILELVNLH